MACQFSIPFTGQPESILSKARGAVQGQGGTFTGDNASGNFSVSAFGNNIVGNYSVADQAINIVITDKPFMLPCSAIESFLKSQLK